MFVASARHFDAVELAVTALKIVPALGYVAFDRLVLFHTSILLFGGIVAAFFFNYVFNFKFYTGIC